MINEHTKTQTSQMEVTIRDPQWWDKLKTCVEGKGKHKMEDFSWGCLQYGHARAAGFSCKKRFKLSFKKQLIIIEEWGSRVDW